MSNRCNRSGVSLFLILAVLFCLAATAGAREVRIGVGSVLPPYVIKEVDGGMEVDIIREALAEAGHRAVFVYLPNPRLVLDLGKGDLEGVAVNSAYNLAAEAGYPVFRSDTTLSYRNYAITRRDDDIVINSLEDLRGKCITAFFNASKYLGPEYADVVRGNECYRELGDQSLHVGMLYAGRTDVLISDKWIFFYWRNKLAASVKSRGLDLSQPVVFHPIFPPSPRSVFFMDKRLCDDLDRGLKILRKRGGVKAIMAKYVDPD